MFSVLSMFVNDDMKNTPTPYRNLGTTLAPEMVPSLLIIHDIGTAPNNWSWSPGGGIPHAPHFHEQGWLQDQNQWHHNLPGCHKIVSCCQHRNENNWIKKMRKNHFTLSSLMISGYIYYQSRIQAPHINCPAEAWCSGVWMGLKGKCDASSPTLPRLCK